MQNSCDDKFLRSINIRLAVCDIFGHADYKCSGNGMEKNAVITKYGEIEDWDVSRCTSLNGVFEQNYYIRDIRWDLGHIDISKWDTSRITTMEKAFSRLKHLILIFPSGTFLAFNPW